MTTLMNSSWCDGGSPADQEQAELGLNNAKQQPCYTQLL